MKSEAEKAYERLQGMLGEDESIKKKVSFALKREEKIAIFQDIRDILNKKASANELATAVIKCLDEHLKEKEDEAYGRLGPNKGKIRRVEE